MTLLVLGFVVFAALFAATQLAAMAIKPLSQTPGQPLLILLLSAIAVWVYKQFQRRVEARQDAEFTLPGAAAELVTGLAIGFLLYSSVVATMSVDGGIQVHGLRGGIGDLWGILTMGIFAGLFEELLFRGIVFRHLEALLGAWAALTLTSLFFGAAHLVNPGATWFSGVAIAVEAGVLLGAAYMLTRRLWLPIGIHAAWNFTQGWVYSVPASDGFERKGLLLTSFSGPSWLTGGTFGPDASVPALVLTSAVGLWILRKAIVSRNSAVDVAAHA